MNGPLLREAVEDARRGPQRRGNVDNRVNADPEQHGAHGEHTDPDSAEAENAG